MDPKHTNKDIEAGLEAPPSYTPPRDEARSEGKGGRCLKRLGVLAFTFLFLFLVIGRGVGFGGRGLLGMVLPEYREGWDIVRGGEHRWKGLVGGDDAWDGIGAFPASSSYLALPRYPLDFSEIAVIPIPKEARTLVIHADEGAQARVVFEMAAAGGAGLSIQSGSTESPSFVEQLGGEEDGVVGIVLSAGAKKSSTITVTLPTTPISFVAHGDLAFDDADLSAHRFRHFSVSSFGSSGLRINHLNARSGHVQLASGAIQGTFNISRELVLVTTIGDIDANVTLHEPHRPHHGKDKKDQHKDREDHEGPHPPPGGPRPRHHRHDSPHHGPPAVQVFTKTQIGSISLAYDGNISNQTALLSKSVSNIGAVNVSVLKGFKGKFVEGSKIGEASFTADASNPVKIIKEIRTGPGSFIKGLVGPPPPHPSNDDESKRGHHHHHHHDEHDKREVEVDSVDQLVAHHSQSSFDAHPPHGHDHDGPPRPPPHSHHHGPHPPPPGYGFCGAFTSTGRVSLVFQ